MKFDDTKIKEYFNNFNTQFEAIRSTAWNLGTYGEHGANTQKDKFLINTKGLDTIIESIESVPNSGLQMKTQDPNDLHICIGGYQLCNQALLFYFATGKSPTKNVINLTKKIQIDKSNPTFQVSSFSQGIQRRLKEYADTLKEKRKSYRN